MKLICYWQAVSGLFLLILLNALPHGALASVDVAPITMSGSASSINLGPTTIEFSNSVDYVSHPDGGITVDLASNPVVTRISTASSNRGGAMWNPFAGMLGYSGGGDQGWDALIRRQNGNLCYDPALNVAPAANSGAAFTVHGEGSLVIAIPNPTPGNDWRSQIGEEPNEEYRVVNFMYTLPPAGSYRAAVRGPTEVRTNWNQATVYANLDHYFPHDQDLGNLISTEGAQSILNQAKNMAAAGVSWTLFASETRQPKRGWNVYGADWCKKIGQCLLLLRDTNLTTQQRRELADAIVQIGIDHYGIVRDGSYWQMNGGWTHGRIWAVDIAGLLLGDPYIRNIVNDPLNAEMAPGETLSVYPFTEQRQFRPVSATPYTVGTNPAVSDQVAEWGPAVGRHEDTRASEKMPPGPEEVGLPIWTISNDRGNGNDVLSMVLGRSYHATNLRSQVMPRLAYDYLEAAGHAAEITGTKYIRDGIDLTFHDYADYQSRKAAIIAQGALGDFNYLSQGAQKFYDALDPARQFRTRPNRAYPPLVHMDGGRATIEFSQMEPSHGYPITRRDLRWRINDGPWTEVMNAQDGVSISHGGNDGDSIEVQIRLHNQAGHGSWSYFYDAFGVGTVRAPQASDDAYAVIPGDLFESSPRSVLDNDSGDNGLTAILVNDVSHGVLNLRSNGTFTYIPGPDFPGFDSFTYRAELWGLPSATKTVTLSETMDNLALNATITSVSGEQDGREVTHLLDGINDTDNNRWSAEGYPQSVEIDLGADYSLIRLDLYTYKLRGYQYTVEAKSDGGTYVLMIDRSDNTTPGNPISDSFPAGTIARHVKLTVSDGGTYSGDWVSLRELEIFGKPKPSSPQTIWAVAMGLDPSINGGMDDDANDDGKPNFFHFALAQDPLGSAAPQERIRSELVNESQETQLTLTLPVRVGAVFSGNPPTSAPIDNLLYTIHGDEDLVPPWGDLPVQEVTPALSSGLPALADLDGVDGPDWEYRTFRATIPDVANREVGFMWVEVREAP